MMVEIKVKETGIIMSGDHPTKILAGLKTMTRRTYGLEKINHYPDDWEFKRLNNGAIALFWRSNIMEEDIALCKCPYGQVGDRLRVRETWAAEKMFDDMNAKEIEATGIGTISLWYKVADSQVDREGQVRGRWRSSRFMPRWASRITLEITGIRVERLQEITWDDCIAEGAEYMPAAKLREERLDVPHIVFAGLWDSLNAKRGYGWEVNPRVWVIGFKKL